MPLTNYALDNFISQEFSQLTQFNLPEISNQFSQKNFWITNFSLNSIFGGAVSKETRTFSFFFLRRSEAAFSEYDYGRAALNEFISSTPKNPSLYFKALHHFEMMVSMLWQAYALDMKFRGQDRFVKNDGSKYERLNWVYNKSRHFDPSELSPENIHVVWITNNGIQTERYEISNSEIESFLNEIGLMADEICKAGK